MPVSGEEEVNNDYNYREALMMQWWSGSDWLAVYLLCVHTCRCWNLKTDRCLMALYGHTGTVNCLDVHADRLVSGAKDCQVKGKQPFKDLWCQISILFSIQVCCHMMIKESHDEPLSDPADTFLAGLWMFIYVLKLPWYLCTNMWTKAKRCHHAASVESTHREAFWGL